MRNPQSAIRDSQSTIRNPQSTIRNPQSVTPSSKQIVFFVRRFWPDIGGVEKYIYELGRALLTQGHRVSVVAGDPTGSRPPRETHDGIEIHRYPSLRSPLRACFHLTGMRKMLRTADILHISDVEMFEYYHRTVGWLVGPRPIFLTRHGMSGRDPVPPGETARSQRARAFVDAVFDDGSFIQRRIGVTPDLVPDPGLRPEAKDIIQRPEPNTDSAVFIGRLEPDSGIDIYLDAMERLRDDHDLPLRLDVYGDGSLAERLRERAKRAQLPVRWHGATPGAQDRLQDGCLAFVSGRMAILEAMARRRLVVAAYIDPLKRDYVCGEWFSEYIVTGKSGDELAAKTAFYFRHENKRKELVDRAYDRRTAESYMDIWNRQLANPRRPTSTLPRTALLKLAWRLWH